MVSRLLRGVVSVSLEYLPKRLHHHPRQEESHIKDHMAEQERHDVCVKKQKMKMNIVAHTFPPKSYSY